MDLISVIAVLCWAAVLCVRCALDDHPDSFWVTAELLSVQWRKSCLTTAGCAEPRFQVTKVNTGNNQASSISWPVVLKLVEHGSHLFISHWSSGSVDDISLKCEVTGLDPAYRFPRICDTTEAHRVFNNQESIKTSGTSSSNKRKSVLEITGKCFNASLAMQHYDHCPTCLQHQSVAVVEHYSDLDSGWDAWANRHNPDQFLYALLVLSVLTALLSTGFACLLIAYLHQKRRLKGPCSSKLRLANEQLNTVNRPLHAYSSDESKYEVPWENVHTTYRTPKRLMNERNSFTPISSVEVPLPLGAPVSSLNGMAKRRAATTSSFGERHDDSGLDSV